MKHISLDWNVPEYCIKDSKGRDNQEDHRYRQTHDFVCPQLYQSNTHTHTICCSNLSAPSYPLFKQYTFLPLLAPCNIVWISTLENSSRELVGVIEAQLVVYNIINTVYPKSPDTLHCHQHCRILHLSAKWPRHIFFSWSRFIWLWLKTYFIFKCLDWNMNVKMHKNRDFCHFFPHWWYRLCGLYV